jgi:2-iminobutanoate/2-iminopropanoate deaminase
MNTQSRRDLIKNAAKAAVVATGGAVVAQKASAQSEKLEKKNATAKPGAPKLPFTAVVSYGNVLYVSGIGCPNPGTIEEQTTWVLDQIEQNLIASGSSLQKVLKVNVFLEDIKMFDRMNAVYKKRNWGDVFPARNTTAPAGLPGTDKGLAIDCIAYV